MNKLDIRSKECIRKVMEVSDKIQYGYDLAGKTEVKEFFRLANLITSDTNMAKKMDIEIHRQKFIKENPAKDSDYSLHPDKRVICCSKELIYQNEIAYRSDDYEYELSDGYWYDPCSNTFFGIFTLK